MTSFILLFLRYTLGNFLIIPLVYVSKSLRQRLAFEKKYGVLKGSFVSKDLWFHVSSEGEWEQAWPLISHFLENTQESVTVWFTSPSLMNKVDKIKSQSDYGSRLTIYALGLLCFNPWSVRSILSYSAPKLFFMVRYDFFPELMNQGLRANSFILLSGTLKNKTNNEHIPLVKAAFLRSRYAYYNSIIAATDTDVMRFKKLLGDKAKGTMIQSYDFRHRQIRLRQQEQTNLRSSHFADSFKQLLSPYSFDRRIILGNFWFHEIPLFTPEFMEEIKNKNYLVFIAPHQLKGSEFTKIKDWFENQEGIDLVIWDKVGVHGAGNFILCQVPGLLCEVYPFFGHCYIGNGFGRSIHSILEPFWGGGNLYCGPKINRSTEYDFAREYYKQEEGIDMPFVMKDLHDFYALLKQNINIPQRHSKLEQLDQKISAKMKGLLDVFQQMLKD